MTVLPMLDAVPLDGQAGEHPDLTPGEIEAGEILGRTIDVEDDEDSGVGPDEVPPEPRDASAARLVEALRDYGVTVSVEWQPGRPGVRTGFVGCCGHHTAGRHRSSSGTLLLTPSLSIIKYGRKGLPGPLANGYLGRDLVARMITMGGANHSGSGGPLRLGDVVVARNDGRSRLFGWEIEHDGRGEPWTDEMCDAAARCHAATVDVFGGGNVDRHCEHSTWAPGRKIDRVGYSLARAKAEIVTVKSGGGMTQRLLRLTRPYTRGADVARLQQNLLDAGYPVGMIDGVFGPGTEHAVKAFQAAHGLIVDGVYGPSTCAVLEAPDPDSWVIGEIRERWLRDQDLLGLALGPERVATDGHGRFSEFERGSIYWHPHTGAHVVRGSLRAAWWALGGPAGVLGYPTTSEAPGAAWDAREGIGATEQEAVQLFERGWLIWSPEHQGVRTVYEVWRPEEQG